MFNDKEQQDFIARPTTFYVGNQRKDGQHLVTFCFYLKQIRKICSPAYINELRANNEYKEAKK